MTTNTIAKDADPKLCQTIERALTDFLEQHQPHWPRDLHALALQMVEKPLLKLIMQKTQQNQSKAASILGLNRATLRKKLIEYHLLLE